MRCVSLRVRRERESLWGSPRASTSQTSSTSSCLTSRNKQPSSNRTADGTCATVHPSGPARAAGSRSVAGCRVASKAAKGAWRMAHGAWRMGLTVRSQQMARPRQPEGMRAAATAHAGSGPRADHAAHRGIRPGCGISGRGRFNRPVRDAGPGLRGTGPQCIENNGVEDAVEFAVCSCIKIVSQ
jgi:hypothetical protein